MVKKIEKDKRVYITRASYTCLVQVWPATVGIRKFHGCVEYGAAWQKNQCTSNLFKRSTKHSVVLWDYECKKRFGFYPRKGEAWYINQSGRHFKQVLEFSP